MVGWRVFLWVVIVLAICLFLYAVRGVLLPFLIAFALSAILDPFVRKLRLRGWSRFWSVMSIMTVFVGILIGLGTWLGPVVSTQVGNFRGEFDKLISSVVNVKTDDNFFVRW